LHLLRVLLGWNVVIGGLMVPVWASVIAGILAAVLAAMVAREARR